MQVFEKLFELRQHVKELFDGDYAKLLPFAFSSKSFEGKLQCNVLESAVYYLVLDQGSKYSGSLLQVRLGVAVQESVLVEKTVEHAGVYFLFFLNV